MEREREMTVERYMNDQPQCLATTPNSNAQRKNRTILLLHSLFVWPFFLALVITEIGVQTTGGQILGIR